MKRILLLSTGGTIVSGSCDSGLKPKYKSKDIIDKMQEIQSLCSVDSKDILHIDSSNMQCEDWVTIAKEVYRGLLEYDGIIISHGTDTMAYTASMLSFMILNPNKPIILTGSQIPFVQKGSDGKRNILDSFKVAVKGLCGVYIVFNGKIIKGNRAYKMRTENLDAYGSLNYAFVGEIKNGIVKVFNYNKLLINSNTYLDINIQTKVFLLKLIPGTNPEIIDKLYEMGYKGIVIEAFGAGGVPYIKRNLIEKIQWAIKKNMAVVITSQCIYDGADLNKYDVGVKALNAGAISAYDMTTEAAVTKLMWVLGHTDNLLEVKQMMHKNFSNEINIDKICV